MNANSGTDTRIDTSILEDLDFDILCDSEQNGEHPAQWDATVTCGCHIFMCGAHLKQLQTVFRAAEMIELLTGESPIECAHCHISIGLAFVEPIKPSKDS